MGRRAARPRITNNVDDLLKSLDTIEETECYAVKVLNFLRIPVLN